MSPGLIESTEFFHGKLSDERRAALTEATFTKRAGQPDDVAAVVACRYVRTLGTLRMLGKGHCATRF